jgi:hypothetical protein
MSDNCGQDGVCAEAPGCSRHWAERVREVMMETEKLREKVRTLEAALTTETRVALDYQKQRDEARAEVERLQVVGKSLCNETCAWLDGPATTNGDALLRDAIDLWEKAAK